MHQQEVSTGSNSVSNFVWVTHLFSSISCLKVWLDETASFIAPVPHECDGLGASFLFAGTLACIQKRSGIVPTASVISFGLLICFGPFCRRRHGWMKRTALYVRPHGQDGLRALSFFAATSACVLKGAGWVSAV